MSNLEQYLDPSFVYRFEQGPQVVADIEQAKQDGINCISLTHLAIESLFNYRLPEDLHCAELYQDAGYFDEISSLSAMEVGDVIWFGVETPTIEPGAFVPVYEDGILVNWRDFPVKHAGIFHGWSSNGEPEILHATHLAGTNVIWPLSKFAEFRRYQKIYSVRRLKEQYQSIVL